MGKIEKKKIRLQERIDHLQHELTVHLTKKSSNSKEIDIAGYQRRILEMRKQLSKL
jgi:hypothetical protein